MQWHFYFNNYNYRVVHRSVEGNKDGDISFGTKKVLARAFFSQKGKK